jgi:hypothetical protein
MKVTTKNGIEKELLEIKANLSPGKTERNENTVPLLVMGNIVKKPGFGSNLNRNIDHAVEAGRAREKVMDPGEWTYDRLGRNV